MVVVAMESDVGAIAKTPVDEVCATVFVVPVLLGRSGVRCGGSVSFASRLCMQRWMSRVVCSSRGRGFEWWKSAGVITIQPTQSRTSNDMSVDSSSSRVYHVIVKCWLVLCSSAM